MTVISLIPGLIMAARKGRLVKQQERKRGKRSTTVRSRTPFHHANFMPAGNDAVSSDAVMIVTMKNVRDEMKGVTGALIV